MDNEFFSNIYLIDFYEKKFCEEDTMYNSSSITSFVRRIIEEETNKYRRKHLAEVCIKRMQNNIGVTDDIIMSILSQGKGKISLYGYCVSEILGHRGYTTTYNLYIHSCTINEANVLFASCLELIKSSKEDETIYYSKGHDNYTIGVEHIYIKIGLEVYKDRNQILRNVGIAPDKHGFDLEVGYFCTTSCLILAIDDFIPLDEETVQILREEDSDDNNIPYGFHNIDRDLVECTELSYNLYSIEGIDENIVRCVEIVTIDIPMELILEEEVPIIETKLYEPICLLPNLKLYLLNYRPLIIGISTNRYSAFVTSIPRIAKDIIKLLMKYWLEAEYILAKKKALAN